MKRVVKTVLLLVALGAATAGWFAFDRYTTRYPSTDDAYVTADAIHVAPQIGGSVEAVRVSNQQHVPRGATLYTIERRPFELALEKAEAHLARTRQQVAEQQARVASAEAEVERARVQLENARRRARRTGELQSDHYLPQQSADDAEAEFRAARAALAVAEARLNEARQRLGASGDANESIREARAALEETRWDLDHTSVAASCNGQVAELGLTSGDTVRTGQPNFVLVCDGTYLVTANFKETQLGRIAPGQPVQMEVDMYPDHPFHGEVASVGAASGVAFSLLPPQNASGNWVKVTQRVPVRIRVLDADSGHPLRVGTSVSVRIDTGAGATP